MLFGPASPTPSQAVPPPEEERRRHRRLRVSLPVRFHLEDASGPVQGQGVLRDVSLSGAYFFCDTPFPLAPGHTIRMVITCYVPTLGPWGTSHLQATGTVVRLENPGAVGTPLGIAVAFQEGLSFSGASPSADKCLYK